MITIPTGAKPTPPPAKPGLLFDKEKHLYRMNVATNSAEYRRVVGVTTLIGKTLAKPGLTDWQVRQVATAVRLNLPEVLALHGDVASGRMSAEAFDSRLVEMSNEKRNKAGARGTAVHDAAEKIVQGHKVELPASREVQKPVNQYLQWVEEWEVEPILSERQCGHRGNWYAGTFDLIAKFHAGPYAGQTWMVDYKTSTKIRPETVLQTIAYARAEFYVDENNQDRPMPPVDGIGGLHLTNTGHPFYDFGDMETAAAELDAIILLHHSAKRREQLIERKAS